MLAAPPQAKDPADTADKIRNRNDRIIINTIGFDVDVEGAQQLQDIAGRNGQYFAASDEKAISSSLKAILQSTCD